MASAPRREPRRLSLEEDCSLTQSVLWLAVARAGARRPGSEDAGAPLLTNSGSPPTLASNDKQPACALWAKLSGGGGPTSTTTMLGPRSRRAYPDCGASGGRPTGFCHRPTRWPALPDRLRPTPLKRARLPSPKRKCRSIGTMAASAPTKALAGVRPRSRKHCRTGSKSSTSSTRSVGCGRCGRRRRKSGARFPHRAVFCERSSWRSRPARHRSVSTIRSGPPAERGPPARFARPRTGSWLAVKAEHAWPHRTRAPPHRGAIANATAKTLSAGPLSRVPRRNACRAYPPATSPAATGGQALGILCADGIEVAQPAEAMQLARPGLAHDGMRKWRASSKIARSRRRAQNCRTSSHRQSWDRARASPAAPSAIRPSRRGSAGAGVAIGARRPASATRAPIDQQQRALDLLARGQTGAQPRPCRRLRRCRRFRGRVLHMAPVSPAAEARQDRGPQSLWVAARAQQSRRRRAT